MAFRDAYRKQVGLLIRILPLIAEETCFALKGGTAINLFVRDMPRLSVDVDLTYVPVAPRAVSLKALDAAMRRIADRIRKAIPGAQINTTQMEGAVTRLIVRQGGVQTKIEVTPVLRGCVFEPETRSVSATVEATFGFAEIAVVSFADLYAGKIVAALDRQHPRDLFDVRDLLANEGIDDALRTAFFLQLFALVSPLFFQVVIDKVLVHRGLTTLDVLVIGLVVVSVFESMLAALRTYVFSHTTNRIDVELGARLFRHLVALPVAYFESRWRQRRACTRARKYP
jgi:predicted nucleotidyltransferase component of viral defense system